ncbi:aminoglycoside phosphotransferase family protein [Caldilinea sp.]|uniref:aminoglycoside phosphotransferase family protein n=1 Tax=Caldilinea sp. TaxID=2293560 RepID=UPI002C3C7A2E|nr:aminoglycoside phosphotransferase family protein [Caldilinea sp.]
MNLPPSLVTTIRNAFGEEGHAFLHNLPTLLDEYVQRWELTLLPAFTNLSYNYVTPAVRRDGSEAVLKLGVPHRDSRSEREALAFYAGSGCVHLLEADADRAALLLARLRPGALLRPLAFEDDVQATAIIAEVMRALWRPAPALHAMLTIGEWAKELVELRATFGGGVGPYPSHLIDIAEHLFAELLASSGPPVVLHGDLHHENILSTQGGRWLAIDPKGVVGEREFEVYALLRNPLGWPFTQPDVACALRRRIDQVADLLALDRERMRLWSVAQCVLSAWWDYDASNPASGQDDLRIAEILWKLR